MNQRSDLEQAIVNNVKLARTLIRLRHSIEADEELNRVLPVLRRRLEAQAQAGEVLGLQPGELRDIILGEA